MIYEPVRVYASLILEEGCAELGDWFFSSPMVLLLHVKSSFVRKRCARTHAVLVLVLKVL